MQPSLLLQTLSGTLEAHLLPTAEHLDSTTIVMGLSSLAILRFLLAAFSASEIPLNQLTLFRKLPAACKLSLFKLTQLTCICCTFKYLLNMTNSYIPSHLLFLVLSF
eukprot:c34414_g1_i1 orf=52-372(-)